MEMVESLAQKTRVPLEISYRKLKSDGLEGEGRNEGD